MTWEGRNLLMIYCVLGLMISDVRGEEDLRHDILCGRFDDK